MVRSLHGDALLAIRRSAHCAPTVAATGGYACAGEDPPRDARAKRRTLGRPPTTGQVGAVQCPALACKGGAFMTPYPRKDPKAQTGSNLRGRSLRKFREAQLAQEKQSRERIAKAHYRVAKKLISKADVRRAAEIARQLNAEWRKASVKAGSDSVGIDALKVSARAKLERRLARELAGYREWKALEKVHLREQGKITQATRACRSTGAI
jgi:hypothetical protein